jgi:hypothetical protein
MDKKLISTLLKEFHTILIQWKQGKLYLLWDHHKYINPLKQAPRVYVGKCRIKPARHEYSPNVFYIHSYEER